MKKYGMKRKKNGKFAVADSFLVKEICEKSPYEMSKLELTERWTQILERVYAATGEKVKIKYCQDCVRNLLKKHEMKSEVESPTGSGQLPEKKRI